MKKLLALFGIVFILAAPAHAGILNIQTVTSSSGIKAWLVEDHSIPVISLNFAFKNAGAALDGQDKQGLAQLASNTMDEGAGPLDSEVFQKELRDLSISLSFGAGRDHFEGGVKTLSVNKARAFELLKLALTQPRFDAEPLERMRAANESRIRESIGDPNWIAARLQNDAIFAGHPYALNAGGTLTTLKSITEDDLHNFVKTRLGRNNLVVSVAGDITPADLSKLLDDVFGILPEVKLPPVADVTLQNQGKTILYAKDIPQTIVQIMQPGIDRHDPDYQTAQVMNFILGGSGFGSHLMEEVREKRGLTYGIYTSFYDSDHFQGYTVATSTANANTKQVLDLTKAEWQKMTAAPPTAKEMDDAKAYLIGSLPLSLASTGDIAGLLQSLQIDDLPIDYLDQRAAGIAKTTPADVQRVAQRLLNSASFVTVLVGNPGKIEGATLVDKLPNVE